MLCKDEFMSQKRKPKFGNAYQNIADKFGLLDRPEKAVQSARNHGNEDDFAHYCRKNKVKRVISKQHASIY